MGPIYDTDTVNKASTNNTVNRAGEDCSCSDPADQCFFLHADMLHESLACIGIAHDPEVDMAYGAAYWAFDTMGDNSGDGGQLVKFDFSQPHGPRSMDHSIASVRRYPEVKLYSEDSSREQRQHGHDTSHSVPVGDDSNSDVPSDDDSSDWDPLPEAESSSAEYALSFGGFSALMFVTLSWTHNN